jgi:tetratricopeptide (TPR) repeat protein
MNMNELQVLTYSLFGRTDLTASPSPDEHHYYTRNTSETWVMLGIGLLALTVYLFTLAPGVYPGSSAAAMGKALGLLPSAPVTHPLWLLASKAVAALPAFGAPLRLNFFSAVCGSLAVAWLFRVTKRIIFELIREAPSIRLVPVADEEPSSLPPPASDNRPNEANSEAMEHLFATLGGVVAALCFAFCAPFWLASTSLHAQPLDILLLLVTADLLACYHFTGKTSACVMAVFLLGLGLVESVIFVPLAPLALVVLLLASVRYDQISESFLLLMLASCLSGLAANVGLFLVLSDVGHAFNSDVLFRLLSSLALAHSDEFMRGLPKTGWLFVLLQTTAPVLIACVSVCRFTSHQDDIKRWKWGITNILFTAVSVACLLNLPKTAWALARESGHLPVIPCMAIAIASGVLFVYWCLTANMPSCNASFELAPPPLTLRLLGFGMCGLLGVVTLRSLYTNINDADGRKSAFADLVASDLIWQAGTARCLMTDGLLDMNLLIRSHLTGGKIALLPSIPDIRQTKAGQPDRPAPLRLSLPGTESSERPSSDAFVARWLRENPKEQAQVAAVGNPDVWQRAGLLPVPNGLLYIGADPRSPFDGKTLLSRNQGYWRPLALLISDDRTLLPELRALRARLRTHTSRLANDLGVLLEMRGELPEAEVAYAEALHLDELNVSAGLNLCGLRLQKGTPGASQAFVKLAAKFASQPGFFAAFDVLAARCGKLLSREADALLPTVMTPYDLGSKPPASTFLLLEKWLSACRSAPQVKPPALPAAASSLGTVPDAMLSQALAMLLNGQNAKAEKLLRLLVSNRPTNLSAWALLAEVLMARGEWKEVNESVLPAMRAVPAKTAHTLTDSTLADMTQGCLLLRITPADPAGARACFDRALTQNPTLVAACDELLRADTLLGKATQLEADALRIVGQVPEHAAANAVLGSFRLGQKRYDEAERFLRQSLAAQLSAGPLNDLAELLRQQNKLPEAEQQARRALRLDPAFYQAWDTLCNILVEQGQLDEAYGHLRCALALNADDPRLYLTLTRLRIKEGNLREASRILDASKILLGKTSPSVRDEHTQLARSLQTPRVGP